jgi:hypothetical protein
MAVHDVEVDPLHPGGLNFPELLTQTSEIGG